MNGSLAANADLLGGLMNGVRDLRIARCAVCVPYPYLAQVQELLKGSDIAWGAQNLSEYVAGAYTGEVSGAMLAEFGCSYVTVGHSERRTMLAEGDRQVAAKYAAALHAGLTPILCVGESLAEREGGSTEKVVRRQLDAVVEQVGAAGMARGVLAYEPVWAIGTGKTASPDAAQTIHAFLRGVLARAGVGDTMTIIYGGSVNAQNAAELFAMDDLDGGLIGGASLKVEEFVAICRAADRQKEKWKQY